MVEKNPVTSHFAAAFRKHLDGDLEMAEKLYRELILADPASADAKHYLGFLMQQSDRLPEAMEQISAAIALDESHAEWHFNLGIVLKKQDLIHAAIDAFYTATTIDPDKYFYWTNLGVALEKIGEYSRSEHCYKTASQLDPNCPDAFYLLSALYLKLERFAEARYFNYRGIVIDPADSHSKIVLGQALYELGRSNDAITLFENWLQEEPDNPVARHLLIAYQGSPAPAQCTSQYIERTFDSFANSFEHTLGRLHYCGPQLVQNHLSTLGLTAKSLKILDLGCGTGLVGEILSPYAQELVGVDLSQAMLDKAVNKQLYHRLHKTDLQEFLFSSSERYDLITCMDTIIYLGRLEEILALIFNQLNAGGLFIFSTEKTSGDHQLEYQLNVSGRYSHHPNYLQNLLNNAGFKIEKIHDVDIRKESGCPIIGQFICASRPPRENFSIKFGE